MAVHMELSRILIRKNLPYHTIELREVGGERVFAIEIGLNEAAAIERRLAGREVSRPQTHELLSSVIDTMGGKTERVVVNDLVQDGQTGEGTFLARLYVRQNGKLLNIDSRPSDAIALGIATNVPIYVEDHVLDEVSKLP